MPHLKELLTDAGLCVTEFAALIDVHRMTVQRWLTGTPIRQSMTQKAVANMSELIRKAVNMGVLPIKADIPWPERLAAIRRALRKAHQTP